MFRCQEFEATRSYRLDGIRDSNEGEQIRAIVCDICLQEVEVIRFGTGFVGVCCNKVLYNDEDKPEFDAEQYEEQEAYMQLSP